MKMRIKFTFFLFALLTMIILLLLGCSPGQKGSEENEMINDNLVAENHNVLSPSGKFSLEMAISQSDNVKGFSFIVRGASSTIEIFRSDDFFRLRDTNYLFWGDNDTIWVYSSDLGTFYWENTADTWTKKTYSENGERVIVPEILRKLKPQYFK